MVDYLPDNAPSTQAIHVMEEEFGSNVADTRVMMKDVSIQEALSIKASIDEIDGVSEVMWLDDVIDMKIPIEMADVDTVESYYKDKNALFTLSIEEGKEVEATDAIYDMIGEDNALSGDALNTAEAQKTTGKETINAALILVPIIVLILLVSTRSWAEPLFLLIAIGVSILINLGTNIFIGEISFVSQAVAPILQLAVSLDYAIFLLHSFDDHRKKMESPYEAMKQAIKRSFPAIAASAATTFFGFLALTFMKFEIGADLGVNLVKGILLSFLSVMIFLPALTIMFYHWIDKTRHKPLLPSEYNIGKYVMKLRIPMLLFAVLVIVPAFLAQSGTDFIYGMGELSEDSRAGQDAAVIEDEFGKYTPMVFLVPKGDLARENELIEELEKQNDVKSIVSYTNAVGAAIPPEYLEDEVIESFFSENYSRLILNTSIDTEGEETFTFVEEVLSTVEDYYGNDYYAMGESITLYDMKDIVQKDNTLVNTLTIVTIALVLLVTFRSLSFPVVLLLTIQTSVWINLSIPYLTDDPLVYIGYLIISIVQLAATVDYAILFSVDYTTHRKEMHALPAIKKTINEKVFSIAVPASILSSVGFILSFTSTDPIISSIGLLLGRGTLLAFFLVVFLLPALLVMLDWIMEKGTWKANFYRGK